MKKKILLLPLIFICLILVGCDKKIKQFYLDEEYYKNSEFIELDKNTLNNLIEDKKSFVIFIYQPLCAASVEFNKVLDEFLETNQITIYKMPYSEMKETELSKHIKYYPSFVIYHDGKFVSYLDASSDEDKKYYSTKEEFMNWFTKYILLK